MFLAEALQAHSGTVSTSPCLIWPPRQHVQRPLFGALYPQTFFGRAPSGLPHEPREAPPWIRLPIEILVLAFLLVGVLPALTIGPFLATAVRSVLGESAPAYSLAIWHGFTIPLLMSLVALLGGIALYVLFRAKLNDTERPPFIGRLKGRRTFEAVLAVIVEAARALLRWSGTKRLQVQLRLVILAALVAGTLPFLRFGYSRGPVPDTLIDPIFGLLWILGGACAIAAAALAKFHRLVALVMIGGAGLATCISFIWLSAPDLALTQLLVEIVTLVLLLLGLRWLPQRLPDVWPTGHKPGTVGFRRGGDLVIALLGGAGMAALAYAMMTRPLPDTCHAISSSKPILCGVVPMSSTSSSSISGV